MEDKQTSEIATWAVVEVMGHKKLVGFCQTVAFGSNVMLRVDVPELPERTETQYGSAYKLPAEPAYTQYVGMGSIYCLTPTTENFARDAADRLRKAPAIRLDVPSRAGPALNGPSESGTWDHFETDNDDDDSNEPGNSPTNDTM